MGDAPLPARDDLDAERARRAGLVHDLRTPVTLVSGFADLLLRRGDELTPEQREDFLRRIADAADELVRLLDADREERRGG